MPSDPSAAVSNMTVTAAQASAYATGIRAGLRADGVEHQLRHRQMVANLARQIGAGGKVCVFTSAGVHLSPTRMGDSPR